ncbi:MAG TPA: FliH/SctL family protein [Rhizomicrobium sp.]|nr:FliH/SctL family protein [Rhizomicrobium sp.]
MSATKYTFDTVFADPSDPTGEGARARRRRTFSEAEVQQLCAQARAEGVSSGEVRAQEAIALATREASQAIKAALALIERERRRLMEENAQIALAVGTKLAHAALTEFPQAEVETALRAALHQAIDEPRVVLRASPEVAEKIAPRASEIAHEEGFEGRVQIAADAALTRADCRIEWRGGGAERASAAIETALQELIARNFRDGEDRGAGHGE